MAVGMMPTHHLVLTCFLCRVAGSLETVPVSIECPGLISRSRCAPNLSQDVMESDMEIVSAMKQRLQTKLGAERLAMIESLAVFSVVGNTLRVVAENSFALDRVRRKHRHELDEAAASLGTCIGSIEYHIDASVGETLRAKASAAKPAPVSTAAQATAPRVGDISAKPARRKYVTFEEFVVGSSNRLAVAAAKSVLSNDGVSPLVLVGPTSSGKSHLLEAIWGQARQLPTLRRVVHLTAEQFLNQFVEALKGTGLPNFRRKYRDLDLLLLDDVQYLAGKTHTIVEFQHTLDALLQAGRRVVLTMDRAPREINGLGDELTGRLAVGLTVTLGRPDETTRLEMLRRGAAQRGLQVDDELLIEQAAVLPADARVLAGAINRLHAATAAFGEKVTREAAWELLRDLRRPAERTIRLDDIAAAVCEEFRIEPELLQSDARAAAVSRPRMLAMFLARRHTRAPLGEIGRFFGRRSHTTVLSAESKVQEWLAGAKASPAGITFSDALKRIENRLRTA